MANVAVSVVSYILLFILISGLAGTVEFHEFKKQFRDKVPIMVGFCGQFILLPFLGFCSVMLFGLTELGKDDAQTVVAVNATTGNVTTTVTVPDRGVVGIEAVILMMTTSSPGGSYSNWWCFIFNADLALSVAMTTVSSISSVFMLPLNLAIYLNATNSDSIDIEYGPLSIAVAVVVVAVACGLASSHVFPNHRHVFHTSANVAGLSLITLGLVFTTGSREGLFGQPWEFFAGVAMPCVAGLILSNVMSFAVGLNKPQCVSVAIETCYQNTALALSVALASPAPARAAAVPVFYQVVQMVSLLTYSLFSWKMGWTYAPSNVSFWRMIVTNYQPVFQRESAAIKEELEKAKTALKEAKKDHRGMHSPHARSPENTVKGAGAASSILASVFPSTSANGRKVAPQPRTGVEDDMDFSDSPTTPTRPGHSRTKSALGLGLGEIEQEALDKVEKGTSRKGHLHDSEADDLITPLRTRVKALEELNIQVARKSTLKTSYWDFVSVLQGSATSVARTVSRIPGRISDSIMGSGRTTPAGSVASTPRGSHANLEVFRGRASKNQVAPMPSLDTPGDDNKRDSPA